jgi:2-polyprenyl-3-methyl-5-hydroxy-6-metoxy-1,4-benzoquinol methylase
MTTPTENDSAGTPADRLRRSWVANADAWSDAVRKDQIESRRVATDDAVLGAVLDAGPARVLDVGCGEGWLCRALAEHDVDALGVDASAPLIEAARERGGGTFYALSYAEMADDPGRLGEAYDVVVCNFALLDDDLQPLLTALHALCAPTARLVVQTVHPWAACEDQPYADGWRTEDFRGFGEAFDEPMPWYFRTLESWGTTLHEADWAIRRLAEPRHPDTEAPLSLLLTCTTRPD